MHLTRCDLAVRAPPLSQFRSLTEIDPANALVDGLREGLWNAASPLRTTPRTTYVTGSPVGPPEDGLTLQMFQGLARAKILALFGL